MLIALVNYEIGLNVIEYFFFQDGEEKSIVVQTTNKNIDYTNYDEALRIVKSKISKSVDEKIKRKRRQEILKKETVKEKKVEKEKLEKTKKRKVLPTVSLEEKIIVFSKEPNLVKTSDEELNCLLREIMTINETSKFELLKELGDDLANYMYLIRNELNEIEKKGIAKIYLYYFNIHFLSKKTRDRVREFFENSESSNMIKIILNIY